MPCSEKQKAQCAAGCQVLVGCACLGVDGGHLRGQHFLFDLPVVPTGSSKWQAGFMPIVETHLAYETSVSG
jgi:hypothetical protein